jgi:hypothetical protein
MKDNISLLERISSSDLKNRPFKKKFKKQSSEISLCKGVLCLPVPSKDDLLLKEAWNPELAALGNSTLPTVCDKLNLSTIHLRRLILL